MGISLREVRAEAQGKLGSVESEPVLQGNVPPASNSG